VVERRYADDFVLEEGRWGGILKKKKKKRGSRGCLFHAWLYDCMMGKERLRK
jgi:hypothetical protein